MVRKKPLERRLTSEELIRVADGIVDPTVEQILVYRDFHAAKLGVTLDAEEVIARLRHIASLYALLRGHERPRPEEGSRTEDRDRGQGYKSPRPPGSAV